MKKLMIFTLLFFGMLFFSVAQSAERFTDNDVKDLMVKVDEGRDRFEDALEGKLKGSLYRSETAEVDIGQALDEFQANMDDMKDKLTQDYSASRETAKILRQGTNINKFIEGHPGIKGESEWRHLAADLKTLANVYGTDFPLPEGAAVRRINDKEVATAADTLAKQADQLKKEVGKDKTLTKEVKESYKEDLEALKKQAKSLKSRISDSKPASAEARSLMASAEAIGQSLQTNQMSPGISSAWNGLESSMRKLAEAFGTVTE